MDEIAKTTAFLLSDGAGYITGRNIVVDGGVTPSPVSVRGMAQGRYRLISFSGRPCACSASATSVWK